MQEAQLATTSGTLRANCIGASDIGTEGQIAFYNDEDLILRSMEQFAQSNQLLNMEYEINNNDLGIYAIGQGNKIIQGTNIDAEIYYFVSPYSVMTLTVIYPAGGRSRIIDRFIGSVYLK